MATHLESYPTGSREPGPRYPAPQRGYGDPASEEAFRARHGEPTARGDLPVRAEAGSGVDPRAGPERGEASTPTTFLCFLCQQDASEEDQFIVTTGCNHRMCRYCARDYILEEIRKAAFPLCCPMCGPSPAQGAAGGTELAGKIHPSDAECVLSDEEVESMYRYSLRTFEQRTQPRHFEEAQYVSVRCSRPGCTGTRDMPSANGQQPNPAMFRCPISSCRRNMCARCRVSPYHISTPCLLRRRPHVYDSVA